MPKHLHIHHHTGCDPAALQRLETTIMAAIDDLAQQIHALTSYVTDTLPGKIAALRSGGNGATDAQLAALSGEIKSDLQAMQEDFATPPPAEVPPPVSPTA